MGFFTDRDAPREWNWFPMTRNASTFSEISFRELYSHPTTCPS